MRRSIPGWNRRLRHAGLTTCVMASALGYCSSSSYEDLLDVFFAILDPTQLNREGPDWGSQYRSVIFTHSDEQVLAARTRIAELSASSSYRQPVVTQVIPATNFWKAEEYHQRYLEKRGMVSCHI
jgi:peptide-methionine (S)-S-oxide reductase